MRKFLIVGGVILAAYLIYRNRIKGAATAARDEAANGVPANGMALARRPALVEPLKAVLTPTARNRPEVKSLPFIKNFSAFRA